MGVWAAWLVSDGNLCCFSHFDNNDGGGDAKGANTRNDNRSQKD